MLTAACLLIAAAVAVSAVVLITHEQRRHASVRDVAAISYVRSFMTSYTTLDPFNANAYTDRVLAEMTGRLRDDYQSRINEIAVQVARAEPTTGTVLDAGVERWNDDGSASVVVATKIVTTMPDGTQIENGNRWVADAIQKGDQWKISNLVQVI